MQVVVRQHTAQSLRYFPGKDKGWLVDWCLTSSEQGFVNCSNWKVFPRHDFEFDSS